MAPVARELWIEAPGVASVRQRVLPAPGAGEALVETVVSAVSRGTERLVFSGRVPPGEWQRMACPFQDGQLPAPVKYGYAAVSRVVAGPDDLAGRLVFSLSPHQDAAVLPLSALLPLPEGLPPRRATLAANMETALNIVWDGAVGPGDRVAVVGAGVVGLLAARLAAGIPGTTVTISDILPERAGTAAALGLAFAAPQDLPGGCDVVIHASASAGGLAAAIAAAGREATVVEASWYGEGTVAAPLGGAFHAGRLRLVSSQVGEVSPSRRPRWSHRRRLATALALCADPALEALIGAETPFREAADAYGGILADSATLAHLFRYRPDIP